MDTNDLSIIIRAAIDPNSQEQKTSLQNQLTELAKGLKLNIGIDANSLNAATNGFNQFGQAMDNLNKKVMNVTGSIARMKDSTKFTSDLSGDAYRGLEQRVNQLKSTVDTETKFTAQLYADGKTLKEARIQYTNEMQQFVTEIMKWKTIVTKNDAGELVTSKIFKTVGFNVSDNTQQRNAIEQQMNLIRDTFKNKAEEIKKVFNTIGTDASQGKVDNFINKALNIDPKNKQEVQSLNNEYKTLKQTLVDLDKENTTRSKAQQEIYDQNYQMIKKIMNAQIDLESGKKGVSNQDFIKQQTDEYQKLIEEIQKAMKASEVFNEQQLRRSMNAIDVSINNQKKLDSKSTLGLSNVTPEDVALFQQKTTRGIQDAYSQYGRLIDDKAIASLEAELEKLSVTTPNVNQKMKELSETLRQIKSDASAASKTFSNEFLHDLEKIAMWTVSGTAFFGSIQLMKDSIKSMMDVEKGMAGVQQVLPDLETSQTKLNQATSDFIGIAEKYGQSVNDVLDAAKLWGKLLPPISVMV